MPIRDASTMFGTNGQTNASSQNNGLLNRFGDIIDNQVDATKKRLSSGYNSNDNSSNGDYYDRASELRSQWESYWKDLQNYFKALYDKELATNRNEFDSARNQANVKRARNERALRGMLGPDSGRGISLLAGNNNTWANTIGALRNNLASANSTSLANYNMNLANGRRDYANKLMELEKYDL